MKVTGLNVAQDVVKAERVGCKRDDNGTIIKAGTVKVKMATINSKVLVLKNKKTLQKHPTLNRGAQNDFLSGIMRPASFSGVKYI